MKERLKFDNVANDTTLNIHYNVQQSCQQYIN